MDYQKKNKLGFVIMERKFVCKRKLSVVGFCCVLNLTGWPQLNSSVHVCSKTTAEFCFAYYQVFIIIAATENSASSWTSGTNQMLLACSFCPWERERERERERESFLHQQTPKNTLRVWRRERVRELKPLKPSLPTPSSSSLLLRLRMHARLARSWRRPHPSIGRYCCIGIFLCLELVSWACRLRLVLAWPSIRALLHCFWTPNTCRPCRRRLHRRRRFL